MTNYYDKTKFSTADFQKGSEFRVDWVIWSRDKRGFLNASNRKSEIFATFEEAREYTNRDDISGGLIKVRRPNTKNFIPYYNSKKVG